MLEISCLAFLETQNVLDFKLPTLVSAFSIALHTHTEDRKKDGKATISVSVGLTMDVNLAWFFLYHWCHVMSHNSSFLSALSPVTITKNNGAPAIDLVMTQFEEALTVKPVFTLLNKAS
ncbi:hypothetical protein HAX54_006168 [Datura stramonium]|uniref:Uncharacterized protein n=1 Tax=Datura stramonium TaxID=4076 RepID=A0ABS8TAL9_DATST|nr:hypothetical protein [Datura stramonium]